MKTINGILQNVEIRHQAVSKKEPIPKFNRQPYKRTPVMISKLKQLMDRKNPASHRHIQRETSLDISTFNEIIYPDLSKYTRKKLNVYYFTERHK